MHHELDDVQLNDQISNMKFNSICIIVLSAIFVCCDHKEKIDRVIIRGTYNHYALKTVYVGDTIMVIEDKKGIDSIFAIIDTARIKQKIFPKDSLDNENLWYDIHCYSDGKQKNVVSVKTERYTPYFLNNSKIYDGYWLTHFVVKYVKSQNHSKSDKTQIMVVDSSYSEPKDKLK